MASTTEAASLARKLMNQHGVGHLSFELSRSKTKFGECGFVRRVGVAEWVPIRIRLSAELIRVNTLERCEQTILHEIAHALAGHDAGHGPVWQRKAAALGIKPERCYTIQNTVLPLGNFNAFCSDCSQTTPIAIRTKAVKSGATHSCIKHRKRIEWLTRREAFLRAGAAA